HGDLTDHVPYLCSLRSQRLRPLLRAAALRAAADGPHAGTPDYRGRLRATVAHAARDVAVEPWILPRLAGRVLSRGDLSADDLNGFHPSRGVNGLRLGVLIERLGGSAGGPLAAAVVAVGGERDVGWRLLGLSLLGLGLWTGLLADQLGERHVVVGVRERSCPEGGDQAQQG